MNPLVKELQCIMPIANIASVLAYGILSHERAAKLKHASVAAQEIQDKRDKVQVPNGLKLHQYANLYFNARNPMMYKRRAEVSRLAVLRVSLDVLRVRGAVITDCNASSIYARFLAPAQHEFLDFDDIYAERWTHPDNSARQWQHKSRMCAETLVPNSVDPRFITGAYVLNDPAARLLNEAGFTLPVVRKPSLFFC
jgi:hypothetical protein